MTKANVTTYDEGVMTNHFNNWLYLNEARRLSQKQSVSLRKSDLALCRKITSFSDKKVICTFTRPLVLQTGVGSIAADMNTCILDYCDPWKRLVMNNTIKSSCRNTMQWLLKATEDLEWLEKKSKRTGGVQKISGIFFFWKKYLFIRLHYGCHLQNSSHYAWYYAFVAALLQIVKKRLQGDLWNSRLFFLFSEIEKSHTDPCQTNIEAEASLQYCV